jgi:hypothetical protein
MHLKEIPSISTSQNSCVYNKRAIRLVKYLPFILKIIKTQKTPVEKFNPSEIKADVHVVTRIFNMKHRVVL